MRMHTLVCKHTQLSALPIPTTNYVFKKHPLDVQAERWGPIFWDFYFGRRKFGYRTKKKKPISVSFSVSCPQINNKLCGKVSIPLQESKDASRVQQLVLDSPIGQKLLSERSIKRAILSPRTALMNFLVDE